MSLSRQVEVETKFAVADDLPVPHLECLPGVDHGADQPPQQLFATYFDTDDFVLTRAKITLRRRVGGTDSGWHVKLPAGDSRLELHAPLGDEPEKGQAVDPPAVIADALAGLLRGRQVFPIATVANERHVTVLYAENGESIAELCDDHVLSESLLPDGVTQQWREWEFELHPAAVSGNHDGTTLAAHAAQLLLAAGATVADSPSKLRQALGDSYTTHVAPAEQAADSHGEHGFDLGQSLRNDYAQMLRWDPAVRQDSDDAVHQMRVATRRLRSQLGCFSAVLETDKTKPVAKQLQQFARLLGAARDAEVVAALLEDAFAHSDSVAIDAELTKFVSDYLAQRYRDAHYRIVDFLRSDHYFTLLDDVHDLVAAPPFIAEFADCQDRQHDALQRELLSQLTASFATVRRTAALEQNLRAALPADHDSWEEAVHELRKAVKKFRYAVAAAPSVGTKTQKLLGSLKALQDMLGDFQDSVTVRALLADAAAEAHECLHNTFTLGVLSEQIRSNGESALSGLDDALHATDKAFNKVARKLQRKLAETPAKQVKATKKRSKAGKDTQPQDKKKRRKKKKKHN
ncbi:CHAD domain-containing protein [Corynebacterium choanae]|nr:CYTH and CHAD domain-containing protein [Corynebacterium choanae]